MVQFEQIIRETYFELLHSLEYKAVEGGLKNTSSDRYLLIKEIYGNWKNRWGRIFQAHQYELFDSENNPIVEIQQNNWRIDCLETYGNYREQICFRIIDPLGIFKGKTFGNKVPGIINAIKHLHEISQYRSLEHYTLVDKKIQLEEELNLLQKEHEDLTRRLQELEIK